MQQLKKYGITLKRLEPGEIELVRTWRNSAAIAEQMEYREYINVEKQRLWFDQIMESKTAYYFIIIINDKPIGLIHLNRIDFELGSAHAGLFIGEQNYIGTGVVLGASLLLLHFAFYELKINRIYAKVKKANTAAIEYNQLLGFERIFKHNDEFDMFELSKSRYKEKQSFLEKLVNPIS